QQAGGCYKKTKGDRRAHEPMMAKTDFQRKLHHASDSPVCTIVCVPGGATVVQHVWPKTVERALLLPLDAVAGSARPRRTYPPPCWRLRLSVTARTGWISHKVRNATTNSETSRRLSRKQDRERRIRSVDAASVVTAGRHYYELVLRRILGAQI